MQSHRSSIPRDTRVLVVVILVSVSMLWVLARIRFPDRVQTPNPVAPVLAQLAPASAFEDLAASVVRAAPAVESLLFAVDVVQSRAVPLAPLTRATVPVLRFRDGLGVAAIPRADGAALQLAGQGVAEVARDPVSRLMLVRASQATGHAVTSWSPRQSDHPRFLIAADITPQGASLRPLFISALHPVPSAVWSGSIWALAPSVDVGAGTFVFTLDGSFAGLTVEEEGRVAIVPGERLIAEADRLERHGPRIPGHLGFELQLLTPDIAAALGARSGAVVTWVDPRGPAARDLRVADVIERVDDRALLTMEQWNGRAAGVVEGQRIALNVRRRGEPRHIWLTAAVAPEPAGDRPLGLTSRRIAGVGAQVVRVAPGSASARAGLQTRDVITLLGDTEAPTPAQLAHAFDAAPRDRPLAVAVTRGGSHFVVALTRQE